MEHHLTGASMILPIPGIIHSDLGIQAQFWNMMKIKIDEILNLENEQEPKIKSQFLIENLLKDENYEKEESNDIPSPSTSVSSTVSNSFTLQSLQNLDRRSRNKKGNSSQRCVCETCGKSYATTSNLSRHKQTHRSLDSPHAKQCPHCDRVYVSMPALSMHILTHNANHECNVCGKRFSRLWLLQGHLRSHSGIRPFSCAHCGKSFADRSNLRAHILTHTGDKRFECDKCGRRFALRSYLNRHVESCCK